MKVRKSIKVLCIVIAITFLPTKLCSAAINNSVSENQYLDVVGNDIYLETDDIQQLFNTEGNTGIYTANEVVDMYIHSLEDDKQQEFITEVDNNTVNVISGDGVIVIGYSSMIRHTPLTRSTTVPYNSQYSGTIMMQDSVRGDWYTGNVTYSVEFGFDIYSSYWKIYGKDDDVTYSSSPAAMFFNISKYCYNSYSGSGTFYGNEISAKCTAYASVPMYDHESPLSIVVYPNSSYNYAYLGE